MAAVKIGVLFSKKGTLYDLSVHGLLPQRAS